MTTTTAPTYRLAATWGGWTVIDDEANVIHRLAASVREWAEAEATEAGYPIRPTSPPAPVELDPEPTCDHCARTQEEGDWCGSCGCCTTHCEQQRGCAVEVRKIGRAEAHARYNAGQRIAMAGESWWFDQPTRAHTFTRSSLGGVSFAGLHTARSGARYSYAAPVEG